MNPNFLDRDKIKLVAVWKEEKRGESQEYKIIGKRQNNTLGIYIFCLFGARLMLIQNIEIISYLS